MKIQFTIQKKNKQMERKRNLLVKDDTTKCVTIGFVIYYFSVQEVSKDNSVSTGISSVDLSSNLESARLTKGTNAHVFSSDLHMYCVAHAGSMVTLFIN